VTQRTIAAAAAVVVFGSIVTIAPREAPVATAAADATLAARRPNVVIVLTDDQRWDQLGMMPTVRKQLRANGRTFRNAFAVDPLCCPSRVSLLRGQYPHTTRIYRISGPLGGAKAFRTNGGEATTIATMLDDAGYRTAMVGKYLNGYGESDFGHVPSGWDVWRAFSTTGSVPYFDYRMSVDGSTVSFGDSPRDYATDVLARQATGFVRSTPKGTPLFLLLSTGAPHAPSTPAPRHAGSGRCDARRPPPSFGEPRIGDKPRYVASRGWNPTLAARARRQRIDSCRALLAVDDAVRKVLRALQDTGRMRSTLIVFTSDNGALYGEHRLFGKKVPYEESIRVPMIVRYDPLTRGRRVSDGRLVINTDVTATALDAAGVEPPYRLEARSLLPALSGRARPRRTAILVEHYDPPGANGYVPTYCAVRTRRHAYVRYDADADPVNEELYDVRRDPYQLRNLMRTRPVPRRLRNDLLDRLRDLCSPVPPGFGY